MSRYTVRLAQPADLARLAAIEAAAGSLFPEQHLPAALRAETTSLESFAEAQQAGRLWVACLPSGDAVGFALTRIVDGNAHLVEMDVHPDHARRGIGSRLLRTVAAWARGEGHRAVTLTTFAHLPWNAPFYQREGFRVLDRDQLGPELAAILCEETDQGLQSRVPMKLLLS